MWTVWLFSVFEPRRVCWAKFRRSCTKCGKTCVRKYWELQFTWLLCGVRCLFGRSELGRLQLWPAVPVQCQGKWRGNCQNMYFRDLLLQYLLMQHLLPQCLLLQYRLLLYLLMQYLLLKYSCCIFSCSISSWCIAYCRISCYSIPRHSIPSKYTISAVSAPAVPLLQYHLL